MNAPLRPPMNAIPLPGKPSWAWYPVGDTMQRISLAWFSNLGAALAPLANNPSLMGLSPINVFALYAVRDFLSTLADPKSYPLDIRASRPVINELLYHLNPVLNELDMTKQAEKLEAAKYSIWSVGARLQTILNGELAIQPVYHLWPIRAYNVEVLIAEGENVFSEEARKEFNEEEIYNLREAGKCLAFQIPTAAAFHIFRCVKSLIRRYYEVVVGKLPKPKMRNWGVYIKALQDCGADQKVVSILEQIKDLHRNPVIHPESRMKDDEALTLMNYG